MFNIYYNNMNKIKMFEKKDFNNKSLFKINYSREKWSLLMIG
jgi:hypothetical protein